MNDDTVTDLVVGQASCGCCAPYTCGLIHLSDLSPEAQAVLRAAIHMAICNVGSRPHAEAQQTLYDTADAFGIKAAKEHVAASVRGAKP